MPNDATLTLRRLALVLGLTACGGHAGAPVATTPGPPAVAAPPPRTLPPPIAVPGGPGVPATDDWAPVVLEGDNAVDVVVRDQTVYLLGQQAVWRSRDGGASFARTGTGPVNCRPPLLVTAAGLVASSCDEALTWVSSDDGASWHQLAGSAHAAVLTADGPAMWGVISDDQLARSSDGGAHWRKLGNPKGCNYPVAVAALGRRVWVDCGAGASFESVDDGASFHAGGYGAAEPFNPSLVWRTDDAGCTLLRSADGGTTWRGVTRRTPEDAGDGSWRCDERDAFTLPARFGPTLWLASGNQVLASRDEGATLVPAGRIPVTPHRLAASSRALFAISYDGTPGVFARSPPAAVPEPAEPVRTLGPFAAPGSTWTQLTGLQVVAVFASGSTVIAQGLTSNDAYLPWVSTDEGTTWRSVPACHLASVFAAARNDPRRIWLSGCGRLGEVPQLSRDGGKTFSPVPGAAGLAVFADDGTLWAFDGNRHVYLSHDDGATWHAEGKPPRDFERMQLVGSSLWALSEFGGSVSHDGGRTWSEPSWQPDAPEVFRPLVVSGPLVYAASASNCALLVSRDQARSWTTLFAHDQEVWLIDDTGKHYRCPADHLVRAVAAEGAEVWAFVGDKLRRGGKAGFRDVAGVPPDGPRSLALTPHALLVVGEGTAGLWVLRR